MGMKLNDYTQCVHSPPQNGIMIFPRGVPYRHFLDGRWILVEWAINRADTLEYGVPRGRQRAIIMTLMVRPTLDQVDKVIHINIPLFDRHWPVGTGS
jgi:hypothetical protein